MNVTRARFILPALLLAASAVAPPAAAAGSCRPDPAWAETRESWAAEILALTNAHRASRGLGQLAPSSSLTSAATWKATHMAAYGYMTHDDPAPPVGRTWDQRIRDCGYSSGAGENIAFGYRTPQTVFQAWLGSDGHRRNIEEPSYKVIGVGAAVNDGGTPYWTQIFGMRVEAGDGLDVPAPAPAPSPSPTPAPTASPSPTPTAPQVPPPDAGSVPVARDDVVSLPEDEAARIAPLANDFGALTLTSVAQPAHGEVRIAAADELVYSPDRDFHGTDSFAYQTVDAAGTVAAGSVTVNVEPRNDAPRAVGDFARASPRRVTTVRVLDNDADVDGDALRVRAIVRGPYYGTAKIDAASGSVVYRPRRGTGGRFDRIVYRVSDGNGGTATASVELQIMRRR